MDAVSSVLGFEVQNMVGKLVAITEYHGSDACFLTSSLLKQHICEGRGGVCLLLLHNSFGHYHNVGMKLGYNLRQLQDKGQVVVVDAMKIVSMCLSMPAKLDKLSSDKERFVRDLFFAVKTAVEEVVRVSNCVCLVVDDMSDLLSLAVPVRDVLSFLQYCRALVLDVPTCCLVMCAHVTAEDEAQCTLAAQLTHLADVTAVVAGLKTGRSVQVSGTLRVMHKSCYNAQQWNRQSFYHYRLHDRHISLFAPGEIK